MTALMLDFLRDVVEGVLRRRRRASTEQERRNGHEGKLHRVFPPVPGAGAVGGGALDPIGMFMGMFMGGGFEAPDVGGAGVGFAAPEPVGAGAGFVAADFAGAGVVFGAPEVDGIGIGAAEPDDIGIVMGADESEGIGMFIGAPPPCLCPEGMLSPVVGGGGDRPAPSGLAPGSNGASGARGLLGSRGDGASTSPPAQATVSAR